MLRMLWFTTGWLCVAAAVAGALLPVIPCTPFVLLAAVCFARSSPQAMEQLRRSPLLGPVLRDWQRYRGMRLRAKITAVIVAVGAPALSYAVNPQLSVPLLISIAGGLAAIGVVCWLPTIRGGAGETTSDAEAAADDIRRAA